MVGTLAFLMRRDSLLSLVSIAGMAMGYTKMDKLKTFGMLVGLLAQIPWAQQQIDAGLYGTLIGIVANAAMHAIYLYLGVRLLMSRTAGGRLRRAHKDINRRAARLAMPVVPAYAGVKQHRGRYKGKRVVKSGQVRFSPEVKRHGQRFTGRYTLAA